MNISQWKNGDRTFFSLEVDDRLLLMSGCISDTDTGIQVTASGAPPHPRPYCRGRVWRSFDTDLESRVFEAPFASLLHTAHIMKPWQASPLHNSHDGNIMISSKTSKQCFLSVSSLNFRHHYYYWCITHCFKHAQNYQQHTVLLLTGINDSCKE